MSEHRFQVGDRVRLNNEGQRTLGMKRHLVGTVVETEPESRGGTYLKVHRDGLKRHSGYYHSSFWELVPLAELSRDEVARSLAHAALRGDDVAAIVLADRVLELCGGTSLIHVATCHATLS